MSDQSSLSSGFLQSVYQYPDAKSCPYNPVVQIVKGKLLKPNFFRAFITDGTKFANSVINPLPVDADNNSIDELSGYVIKMTSWATKVSGDKLYFYIKKLEVLGKAEPLAVEGLEMLLPPPKTAAPTAQPVAAPVQQAPAPVQQYNSSNAAPRKPNMYTPISDLSPYNQKWKIRARLSNKSDVRKFKNGQGELFNATFIDETGEIRATGFTQAVADFYKLLTPQNVYIISHARIVAANKKFNPNQQYEMTLDKGTIIEECNDAEDVPELRANFVALDKLSETAPDSVIDVLAVVHSVGGLNEFTSKQGNNLVKRELSLVDSSGTSVSLTLWNQDANSFDENLTGAVIAAKGVKVSDFGGRSLSLTFSGQLVAQPKVPEAYNLQGWYENSGKNEHFKSAGSGAMAGDSKMNETRMLLGDVLDNNIGMNDKPDYFTCKATVSFISPSTLYYPACTTEGCNKKVHQETDNTWRCEKCDKSMPNANYRYILNMTLNDFTGSIWATAFDDSGETILGLTANQLQQLEQTNNSQHGHIVSTRGRQEMIFRIRSKAEIYQEKTRTRHQMMKVSHLNYAEEFSRMVSLINAYD